MIFHENRLLADDSHVILYLFCRKLGKMWQNLSSATVVIGALKVKCIYIGTHMYTRCQKLSSSFIHILSVLFKKKQHLI